MLINYPHIKQLIKPVKRTLFRLIPILLLLCTQYASAQVVANFSYEKPVCFTEGAGVIVKFKDESYSLNGSPIVEWVWNKGDGSPDLPNKKDPSPEWTYDNPGVYRVTLTVRNLANDQPGFITQLILVYPPVIVNFSSNINEGCNPLTVVMSDLSAPESLVDGATGTSYINKINSWTWDFGDGIQTNVLTNTVSHTYTNSGDFRVRLFIETEGGCKAFGASAPDFIKVEEKVKANFYLPVPDICKFPVNVNASNLSEGAISYKWNVTGPGLANLSDDGFAEPEISFSQPGTYKVQLEATGSNNCVDVYELDYVVSPSPSSAQFSSPSSACPNTNVAFINTSSSPTITNAWYVNDVLVASSKNLTYQFFNSDGINKVRLESLIGSCQYTLEKDIEIYPVLVPDFEADIYTGCNTPLVVKFKDLTPGNIVERIWEFGDEITPYRTTSNEIPHTYYKTGSFYPVLTVINDKLCRVKIMYFTPILIQLPKIISSNLPDSGCVGIEITPNITFNIQNDITEWIWKVVDESGTDVYTATGASPGSFRFDDRGIYTVNLTIKASKFCEKSYSWPVKVGIQPQPFTIYPDKIEDCANSSFKFFYNGTAPEPTTFKWKFSSSDSSFEKNPSRIFKELGPKDVTLTVFDNGCPLSVTEIGMINVKGVVGDFRVNNDCANPLDPQFEDKSLGNIETWQWTFGDGSPDKNYIVAEPPFIHSFANPDKYKIKLTVIGDGCIYTDSTNIIVTNETGIDFNPLAPVCLSDGSTTLKADINNPSFIKKYYWNLGCGERLADDGMFQIMFANTCNGAPYSRGSYPMWIRVVDVNGCEYKSLEKDIYIGGPSAEITALTAVTGCENLTVKFQDNSDVDPNAQIQSRVWDFGDGTSENILSGPISHVFSNLGTSPVRLTVTDEYGCTSTSTMIEVNTSRVDLDFNAGQTISCIARNIQFQTISTSPLVSYQWEFGDGLVSSSPTPRIAYSTSGKKSVRLTVRDGYGCEAIAFKPAYVEIDMPEATFSAVQNTADCPPFDAQFNFEGKYAERFEWVFGDGSKSTTPNPSHLYTTAGKYFVTLKVMSPGGCQVISTPYEIDISGPIGTATFDAFSCEPFDALVKVTSTPDQFVIVDYGDGQVTDRMPYQPQFSHRYADTGFYQPKVFLSNNEGCLVRLPVPNGIKTVDVQPVFKPDNNIFCFNGNVNFSDLSLSNDQFISWDWTMGDGATAAGKNVSHLYTMPGIYDVKLVVKTQLGCVDSVVRVGLIEIKENPEVSIRVSRPIICEDETVEFTATEISSASPIVNWFWDFTNGNSSSLQAPSPESFRKQGVYPVRLYVTDQRGCSDTALVDFIVNALPELEAGPDMQLCLGTPQQLNPSGAQLYQWYAGPTLSCIDCENPLINPTEDAKFYVKGTSVDGCVSYDSIYVEVVGPSTVSAITDTTVCFGDELQLRASGTATYSWSPADGLSATDIANPKARPLQNTTYTVTGSDPYRCFVTTDEVEVRVNPIPQVYAGADTTMMAGYPVQLRPAFSPDVTKVQWEPSTFLNCSDCRTPISNPSYSATYTLFAYNDFGCVSKDVINVFATCTRENLFIPNTFSPNGDGVNEVFFPRGRGIEKIKSLKIFSRWGQMVYSKENFFANDQGAGWNGKRSGVDASTDVYVYMIDLVCENGNIITLKGDIALVR